MEYTALIYDTEHYDDIAFDRMKKACSLFIEDADCKEIVISANKEWIVKLATNPIPKSMYVQMSNKPYVSLLNGLKAVTQENVLVIGLSKELTRESIDALLENLQKYPSVSYTDHVFEAFDTRLLMFCLQYAIEFNMAVDTYSKAVDALADTPIHYIA
ncbi:MAG: hypothetical protein HUJ53_09850 [Holdemanella sp.]|mgnify:CR=1 FL=1|nr:hypothetical protein [Holdemanella sp.]